MIRIVLLFVFLNFIFSKDYYQILGISKKATKNEIKKAYRKLAIKYHPDRVKDEQEKKYNEEKFIQITEAYETLKDDESRRKYDQFGIGKYDKAGGSNGRNGHGNGFDFFFNSGGNNRRQGSSQRSGNFFNSFFNRGNNYNFDNVENLNGEEYKVISRKLNFGIFGEKLFFKYSNEINVVLVINQYGRSNRNNILKYFKNLYDKFLNSPHDVIHFYKIYKSYCDIEIYIGKKFYSIDDVLKKKKAKRNISYKKFLKLLLTIYNENVLGKTECIRIVKDFNIDEMIGGKRNFVVVSDRKNYVGIGVNSVACKYKNIVTFVKESQDVGSSVMFYLNGTKFSTPQKFDMWNFGEKVKQFINVVKIINFNERNVDDVYNLCNDKSCVFFFQRSINESDVENVRRILNPESILFLMNKRFVSKRTGVVFSLLFLQNLHIWEFEFTKKNSLKELKTWIHTRNRPGAIKLTSLNDLPFLKSNLRLYILVGVITIFVLFCGKFIWDLVFFNTALFLVLVVCGYIIYVMVWTLVKIYDFVTVEMSRGYSQQRYYTYRF